MKKLLALLVLTATLSADIIVQPFAQSYHFDRDKGYNETHKLIGVVYEHDSHLATGGNFELGAATMINSYDRRSNTLYVGFNKDFYKVGDWEFGVFGDVGYRTGYDTPLFLAGGGYVDWKALQAKVAVSGTSAVVIFGYRFKTH